MLLTLLGAIYIRTDLLKTGSKIVTNILVIISMNKIINAGLRKVDKISPNDSTSIIIGA